MSASSTSVAAPINQISTAKGFVTNGKTHDAIVAYGEALGWSERPYQFVVDSWLLSRPV